MDKKVVAVSAKVAQHMEQLGKLFKSNVKLSFIARIPGNDEGDLIITDDDLFEIEKAVIRLQVKERQQNSV